MMSGGLERDKRFFQQIVAQLKDGKNLLHVVNDKLETLFYVHQSAVNVKLFLEKKYWVLYNNVCPSLTSRLESVYAVADLLGLRDKVEIVEVVSDFIEEEYFTPGSLSERLMNKKLNFGGVNVMLDWQTVLERIYCRLL